MIGTLRSPLGKEYDIVPQAGDIWRRTLYDRVTLVDAYYLLLLVRHGGKVAFPHEYRMLPLTPHLDKSENFLYEAPLNRWSQWERVG